MEKNDSSVSKCHSCSQVICCSSSYDGVERPLGKAFARSVVDEGHHDDCAVRPAWGELDQLWWEGIKDEG